jgi:hypothetical protein
VITTFDSQFARVGMHLRTIYRDGMICTDVRAQHGRSRRTLSRRDAPCGCAARTFRAMTAARASSTTCGTIPSSGKISGTIRRSGRLRDDLVADLRAHLPEERLPRIPVAAPT